jgi:hypothetical protein
LLQIGAGVKREAQITTMKVWICAGTLILPLSRQAMLLPEGLAFVI